VEHVGIPESSWRMGTGRARGGGDGVVLFGGLEVLLEVGHHLAGFRFLMPVVARNSKRPVFRMML
jgi:hypothetical protein